MGLSLESCALTLGSARETEVGMCLSHLSAILPGPCAASKRAAHSLCRYASRACCRSREKIGRKVNAINIMAGLMILRPAVYPNLCLSRWQ